MLRSTVIDAQILLLQRDSDETMLWGDSGIATFFIDPADLRRGDVSRVADHRDCYRAGAVRLTPRA